MKELVEFLKEYLHSRKIKHKLWDIIEIRINSKAEFTIYLRNIGLLIGKNGSRIKDIENFMSDKYKIEIKVNAKKHCEWFE